MKFLLPAIIAILALFDPLTLSAAERNDTQQIKSIFFQKNNGHEVVQIRLNSKIIPKIFELGGKKPRVVLDFIETVYQPDKIKTINAGGVLVGKIRIGRHDKPNAKTRVVIDMVEGMEYVFSKEYIASSSIFRITFSSPQTQKPDKKDVQTTPIEQVKMAEQQESADDTKKENERSVTQEPKEKIGEETQVEESNAIVKQSAMITEDLEIREAEKDETDTGIEEAVSPEPQKADFAGSTQPDTEEPEDQETPILLDVSYERNSNGSEMVLFRLNGFYPPVVYSAESGELFVACDFLDAELGTDDIAVSTKDARYIRQIKLEPHQQPKKVRVVVELGDRYTYAVKQVFFKEENLFVIVLDSLGEKKKNNGE